MAIVDFDSQKIPNYKKKAKNYNLMPITLLQKYILQIVSKSEVITKFQQRLNTV